MHHPLAHLAQVRLELWIDHTLRGAVIAAVRQIIADKRRGRVQPQQVIVITDDTIHPRHLVSNLPQRYIRPADVNAMEKYILQLMPARLRIADRQVTTITVEVTSKEGTKQVNAEALVFTLELV